MRWPRIAIALTVCALLALSVFIAWPRAGSAESDGAPAVSAGGYHTCAVTSEGGVRCWGANGAGQLGDGTSMNSSVPVDVLGLESGAAAVAGGRYHTCSVTIGGGVKCWGLNNEGQLGDGTTTASWTPVGVAGLDSGIVAAAASRYHTCALTEQGGIKCWGNNQYGQLGNGTTTSSSTPVDVVGLTGGVAAIAAGRDNTCAITTQGGVKCWGLNSHGQLGDGGSTQSSIPADVLDLGNEAAALAAGGYHTCAITNEGAAKCWGHNLYGQLGDGTRKNRSGPVDVIGLSSGVATISAGHTHTCAVTVSGAVKCWGYYAGGQLGDPISTPVDVVGLSSGVVVITAGLRHTCGLTADGHVKCWGENDYGQLGDGTTITRHAPVSVVDAVPTPTATPIPTQISTPTPCPAQVCPTPTETPTGAPTPTPSVAPTGTLIPTPTATATPQSTSTPTPTPTPCPEGKVPANGACSTPTPCPASGCPPGMSLTGPDSVLTGTTFSLLISADTALDVPVAGFTSEVALPAGIEWVQRPECGDEVPVSVEGNPAPLCARSHGSAGEARHAVGSGIIPPVPALDTPLGELVEIDVVCNSPGTHDLVLTAVSGGAGFGAAYFLTDTQQLDVATEEYDGRSVADVHRLTCVQSTHSPGPVMSLSAPSAVLVGEPFTVSVNAESAPVVAVSGFSSEVELPDALEWLQRPACKDEIRATASGSTLQICVRGSGPPGAVRHASSSGVVPPLPPLDSPLAALVEFDVVCTAPGTHDLILTAVSGGSAFGASYFTTGAWPLDVGTEEYDGRSVAAVRRITCLDPALDGDGDGCTNGAELGADATRGGQRDPANFGDFYDVPAPGSTKDKGITAADIFAVIARVGTEGDPTIDPLSPPPESGYHPAYDRGAQVGPNAWNVGPADGSIAATDVFALIAQFGHSCG